MTAQPLCLLDQEVLPHPSGRFVCGRVWRDLQGLMQGSHGRGPRYLALRGVGYHADTLLNLRRGDVVVIDGSPEALWSGSTHWRPVRDWLDRGVEVYSRPGLNAKILVLPDLLVVGSAEASTRSRDELIEAVLTTDDPSARMAALTFVRNLARSSRRLGPDWVDEARALPCTLRPADEVRALAGALIWLATWNTVSSPAADHAARHVENRMQTSADYWVMEDGDEDGYRIGDRLLFVENNGTLSLDSEVSGPATVLDIVPVRIAGRQRPALIHEVGGGITCRLGDITRLLPLGGLGFDLRRDPLPMQVAEAVHQMLQPCG